MALSGTGTSVFCTRNSRIGRIFPFFAADGKKVSLILDIEGIPLQAVGDKKMFHTFGGLGCFLYLNDQRMDFVMLALVSDHWMTVSVLALIEIPSLKLPCFTAAIMLG